MNTNNHWPCFEGSVDVWTQTCLEANPGSTTYQEGTSDKWLDLLDSQFLHLQNEIIKLTFLGYSNIQGGNTFQFLVWCLVCLAVGDEDDYNAVVDKDKERDRVIQRGWIFMTKAKSQTTIGIWRPQSQLSHYFRNTGSKLELQTLQKYNFNGNSLCRDLVIPKDSVLIRF